MSTKLAGGIKATVGEKLAKQLWSLFNVKALPASILKPKSNRQNDHFN